MKEKMYWLRKLHWFVLVSAVLFLVFILGQPVEDEDLEKIFNELSDDDLKYILNKEEERLRKLNLNDNKQLDEDDFNVDTLHKYLQQKQDEKALKQLTEKQRIEVERDELERQLESLDDSQNKPSIAYFLSTDNGGQKHCFYETVHETEEACYNGICIPIQTTRARQKCLLSKK